MLNCKYSISCVLLVVFHLYSCKQKKQGDAIFYNGVVYTVNDSFSVVQAFVVNDGKIVATGNNEEMLEWTAEKKTDLGGRPVYPGFIDAHCHFYGYGVDLSKTWLVGSKSFSEVIDTVKANRNRLYMGWFFGRGWDQNDWKVKEFPDRAVLDSLFPDIPAFLMRIDGHAALVNQKALDLARIDQSTKVAGGEIIVKEGRLTGLLIDNAVDLVKSKIPDPDYKAKVSALLEAQRNCFAVGLTTVDDAGLEHEKITIIDALQQQNKLKMRIYAMVTYDSINSEFYFKRGKLKTERLNVCSFKLYADGALGSRGAALLNSYSDQPGHYGYILKNIDSLKLAARAIAAHGFQMNTHCIGDSAVRLMLTIYHDALQGKRDQRWRIEHAQVVSPDDLKLFGDDGIIPSVQPTHATSDMYWAEERLGPVRIKKAYAYQQLLQQNGMIANGSDFPVEDINPLYGFYAAVVRKDGKGYPPSGFQMEGSLSRIEALKGMTIWAAYSNFEEKEKGSIEPGKYADFVILGDDIMKCSPEKIYNTKVKSTYINGVKVY